MNTNMNELVRLSQPLVELLQNSYNPHCKIVIGFEGLKIVEETCSVPFIEVAHSEE